MQSGALQAYIFIHSFIFINFDSCYPSNYLAGKWSSRLSYFSSDNSQSTRINRSQLLGQNCAAGSTRKQEKKGSKYLCRPLAMSSEYDINSLCEHLNCMRTWAPENAKNLMCHSSLRHRIETNSENFPAYYMNTHRKTPGLNRILKGRDWNIFSNLRASCILTYCYWYFSCNFELWTA